ncbi:auxin-responsive protein SAUR78 [Lactuca sativa]|uniref:auxin-responsive protein SAUR78 n=1 Tax=Lactuca sativa TaxID=4236 RepID=UPI000CBB3536|nr:auxin-responsive protein SAUR78 [Lactuca sativa]
MKKINVILRKCKTLSKQIGRSSSFSSLGSNSKSASARHHHDRAAGDGIVWNTNAISVYGYGGDGDSNVSGGEEEPHEIVFVGSSRKRYVISSKYLSHPLVNALIEKSKPVSDDDDDVSVINCEVVLFDHLLWMLENADFNVTSECLDELADLYSS